ncbi:unnamed protein product, partial [Arabidopsis halleri]
CQSLRKGRRVPVVPMLSSAAFWGDEDDNVFLVDRRGII